MARTPRGRQMTGKGYLHLGLEAPKAAGGDDGQQRLL